jgi:4-alpha-glucanotransferase
MNTTRPRFIAPFSPGYRASGVLLHVTSLPSRYGIGDLGPTAFAWIDRLADAGQAWWQVLPLGPTGFDHSPYQALSSFAANPLVISPDRLIEDRLLKESDCDGQSFPSDYVDFDTVIPFKERILARAWQNYRSGTRNDLRNDFEEFCHKWADLQSEPALFMALRTKHLQASVTTWPLALLRREPGAIAEARSELADTIDQFRFGQFLLLRQWRVLKEHADRRGVRILGDLPIFVSPDSSDVWANPELFLVDDRLKPKVVAGVPPDYFSADGQLWGNPIYDWDALKRTGYRWWINRLQARLQILDGIRIDHFRGLEAAWHIPAGAPTAASGQWVSGPGADFFDKARDAIGGLPLLAEDLGVITPAVTALRDQFQLPGMRVLQFAFNGDPNNPHLPHHAIHNSVVYTGTHDNDTTRGWYDTCPQYERDNLWRYAQRAPGEPSEAVWEMIRLALDCQAALAIVPLQDLLGLGSSARMNIPGHAHGQWRWRCSADALDGAAWQRLSDLTQEARRMAGQPT